MAKARPVGLLLALAALVLALAPAAQARVPKDYIGITSEDVFAGSSSYRDSTISSQASMRIGLTRQTFDWSDIERSKGHYSLTAYDAYVAAEATHGMRVLPILFRAPGFYRRSHGRDACPPRSNKSMASFAQALVARYGPRGSLWKDRPGLRKVPIRSWEIWNEPSLAAYWCGKPKAKAYVKMLKTVGRAIKKRDRHAEIVTAGLPNSLLRRAVRLTKFIKQMYKAKAARYFDTLAINSYAKNKKALTHLLRSVRALMNRSHDRRAKIWITEIGWGDKGPRSRFIVGAKGQASRIKSSIAYIRKARRRLKLRGFVYFSWRDAGAYPPAFQDLWGLHTGLLTRTGAQKPAFAAFQGAVRKLR
ncbi:MAG: hypothetical protein ACJ766_01745 [Thermoleophilaceae bacterium]